MNVPRRLPRLAVARAALAAPTGLVCAIAASAQSMVADFSPLGIGQSGNPDAVVVANGLAFFAAGDQYGIELWRTDGTAGGTFRLRDLHPGAGSSSPAELTAVGTLLYFRADVPGYGRELFVSDGTTAGTRLVRDIHPAPDTGSEPRRLCAFQNRLYFAANDGAAGEELWTSDGTTAGTVRVLDLLPGTAGSEPADLVVWNGALWFVAQAGSGRELHRSDGTAAGTQLLLDLVPGPGSASPTKLTPAGGRLFFTGSETGFGNELYATDGTAGGTQRVHDIQPGPVGSNPSLLTALGSLLVFAASDGVHGQEPWRSDGTAAGTFALGDLFPGLPTSAPQELTAVPGLNRVFFSATDGSARSLWATDGSVANTTAVLPQLIQVGNLGAGLGGVAFAAQTSGSGARLWHSDGTASGTVAVVGSPVPEHPRAYSPTVLFAANVNGVGNELFASDGVTSWLVRDLAVDHASSPFGNVLALGSSLFFSPTLPPVWGAWLSDGTIAGTGELNPALDNPNGAVRWRDQVWFVASTPTTSAELCYSNGTPAGTNVAFDLMPGTATPNILQLTPTTGRLFFTAVTGGGRELWASDGTLAGTAQFDLRPGAAGAQPQALTAFGSRCVFSADDGVVGREAWISDGTPGGTALLADLVPGIGTSTPLEFCAVGQRVWFAATLPGVGRELCVSDGTPAGTSLFADLLAGGGSSSPHALVAAGGRLFFKAQLATGIELMVSDGTVAGTFKVRDIGTAPNVQITDMVGVPNRLFFFADDQVHGKELWTSDGTAAGTVLVADVMPGTGHGAVDGSLRSVPGTSLVVFAAGDPEHGLQLWRSDGSAAGTLRVGQMGTQAGSGATRLSQPTAAATNVFFHGGVGDGAGDELWVAPLQPASAAVSFAYGDALCPGTFGLQPVASAFGLPQPGNGAFAIDVTVARPATLAILALGTAPADLPLDGCRVLVVPAVLSGGVLTDGAGFARTPFPIPASAGLIGAMAFGQYAVLDPAGSLLGGFAASNGVALRVGT